MLEHSHPRSSRGVSGDDPEGGARSGVLRRAARNRSPREAREVARQALRPGCEELAARIGGHAGDGSAAPRPKTATVERREASVPRYGTQGASLGAWRAALCARPTGVPPSTRTFLGAPPTPRFGVSEAKLQTPGAENAPRERDGLFEIVSWTERDAVLILRSAHAEENPQSTNGRARVSKDEDEPMCASSCFETHRSALRLWEQLHSHSAAMLLSMRTRGEAPTCGCGKRSPAPFHCFRLLLTMENATQASEP